MPRLSVWFIRLALAYLATGFTFGALLLANKGLAFAPLLWRLRPTHIELLLVGWMVQLAMGVAFWILPRFQASRGDVRPAWPGLALINLGIAGRPGSGRRSGRLNVAALAGWRVAALPGTPGASSPSDSDRTVWFIQLTGA